MEEVKKVFVNVNNAGKRKEYRKWLEKIATEGVDPFSLEYMESHNKNPILKKYKYWFVTESLTPYPGSIHHFVVISSTYVEFFEELHPEAVTELQLLIKEINKEYGIKGGGFWMRYGDTELTGATVMRLHAHIIAADPEGPGVRIPLK